MTPLSFYSIPVLLATAFIIIVIGREKRRFASGAAIAGAALVLMLSLLTLSQVSASGTLTSQMAGWPAPFGISVVVDSLSVIFIFLTSLIGFLAIMFSHFYIRKNQTEFYALTCVMLAGLLGIMHAGDIFNMFVFFEVMSVSSYALVAFYRNRKALEAGIKYLIMGAFATSLILLGVALLYGSFGTLNLADLASKAGGYSGSLLPVAAGLLFAGFALKSGLFPFHTWLPDAHPAAPAPVSALLSGLVIKGGMYSIMRITFTVLGAPGILLNALMVTGILSMVVGGVLALMQTDLKRLLAYSSISQMGYISLALGLGTQMGISGALFHIVNHAVIKSLLFLCSGVVIYYAGSSDMQKISGAIRSTPLLTYPFLIGVLSLGGVPFFNGFASKWMIYIAALQVSPLLTIFTVLITIMTLAYGLKTFYMVFMSNPGKDSRRVKVPLTAAIPLIVLAGLCILLGLVPSLGYYISDFALGGLEVNTYLEAVLG